MLRGREGFVGPLVGWICSIVLRSGFRGQYIEPDRLNPFREAPRYVEKTQEEIEYQNRRNWVLLDKFFGGD
jgi:hypothetical protein